MEGRGNITNFGAIVVGDESDRHVVSATAIFHRLDVKVAVCQDIYEAVAELARCPARRGLVVGRLEHLSREKGRLFEKTAQAGWVCCCLAKKISGGTRTRAIQAMKSGTILLNNHTQLEQAVMHAMSSHAGTLSGDIA